MQLEDSFLTELTEIVERTIPRGDIFLVDIEIKGSSRNPIVSVYLESDAGGIKLDDCAQISRNLQTVIEANELLGPTFTLNVSSPGLDRPLKQKRQYRANEGRSAKVKARLDDQKGVRVLEGKIVEINETGVGLELKDGNQFIEFEKIIETKIVPAV